MSAHIVGLPLEESLPWMLPISWLGLAGVAALMRAYVFERPRFYGRRGRG